MAGTRWRSVISKIVVEGEYKSQYPKGDLGFLGSLIVLLTSLLTGACSTGIIRTFGA